MTIDFCVVFILNCPSILIKIGLVLILTKNYFAKLDTVIYLTFLIHAYKGKINMLKLRLYDSGIISVIEQNEQIERKRPRPYDEEYYYNSDGKLTRYDYKRAVSISRNFHASLKRTKSSIENLCANNDFKYFLSITFNSNYVDRYNAIEVQQKFKNIVKRLKYTYGSFSYIQVAEFHKDKAIHYHLFCNFGIAPKLKYKGRTDKGQSYYTIQDDFKKEDCFLTIEKIEKNAPIWYLTKYITKGNDYPFRRKYACSRDLKRVEKNKPLLSFEIDTPKSETVFFGGEVSTTDNLINYELNRYCPLYCGFNVFGIPLRYHVNACVDVDSSKSNIKDENIKGTADFLIRLVSKYSGFYKILNADFSGYEAKWSNANA